MVMDAGVWNSYNWSNNDISQAILIKIAGSYSIIITDSNGCLGYDTATVTIDKLPNANLGPDVTVCKYLDIELGVKEKFAKYLWSPTSETSQSISTNTVAMYSVYVVDTNNCSNSDTINVLSGKDLIVDLGDNTVICKGADLDLSPTVINEVGSIKYLWSTSEIEDEINVSVESLYSVLLIDENGCWGDDSIYITVNDLPIIKLVPDTLSICDLTEAQEEFDILTIASGLDIDYIEWGTGELGSSLHVIQSGFYEAIIYDEYGCTGYDSVTIAQYCRPIDVTLPNIFTPNQDGVNDAFVPLELSWEDKDYMMVNIKYINFTIYNRWGQVMYVSTDVLPRWYGYNGRGKECPEGVYFWIVDYENIDGHRSEDNGYVKLKR